MQELGSIVEIAAMVFHPSRFLTSARNIGLWFRAVRASQSLEILARYFNSAYYVRTYPDVSEKGVDPWFHFLLFGNAERRNPSALFDTDFYLTHYPDVAGRDVNALVHYALFGAAEGRPINRVIDPLTRSWQSQPAIAEERTIPVPSVPVAPIPVAAGPRVVNNYWPADRPLLSIVIPCFNYGEYVEQAIRSAMAQTFAGVEIIVVDGGSTDQDTVERLRRLESAKLPRVTFYYRSGRHLVGDNRNFGIAHAQGRYICCLDADDMLSPTFCEIALFLAEGCGYDVVYSSAQCFGASAFRWLLTDASFPQIAEGNQVSTTAIFRKADWAHAGGFRDWQPGVAYVPEDWEFWVRLLGHGCRAKSIREPLYLYRVHQKSLTAVSNMDRERQSRQIRRANAALLDDYAATGDSSVTVRNRWVNFGAAGDDLQPGFLLALPFVSIGGAETLLYALAEEITRKGFRLIVVTSLALPAVVPDRVKNFEALTPHVYPLAHLFHDAGLAEEFLLKLIPRYRVSHLFFAGCDLVYHLLPRLRHEFPQLAVIDQLFNDEVHASNNRHYGEYIDATVVPSEALKSSLLDRAPENPGAIYVVPHSVTIPTRETRAPREIRTELSLPEDKIIVAFFGRLSPEKGGEIFIEIARMLGDDNDSFFLMTGEGPERQRILELIERYGMKSRIHAPGFVDDVGPLIHAADIVVVPSLLDGMPLVVLEAQARGKVVVASSVGSIPSIISDGETGYLCPPGDIAAFTRRIAQLAADPSLRLAVGRAASMMVRQHHGSGNMLRSYVEVFSQARSRAAKAQGCSAGLEQFVDPRTTRRKGPLVNR
jgi:glycosyltransferase involved in cell wall biosynthesis